MDPIDILESQVQEAADTLEILDSCSKSLANAVYLHAARLESLSATVQAIREAQNRAQEMATPEPVEEDSADSKEDE